MTNRAVQDDRLAEIEELFDQADEDADSVISFLEFKTLMRDLDEHASPQSLEVGFREIDADHDGQISFGEFRAWWCSN